MSIIDFLKKNYVDIPELIANDKLESGAYIYLNPFNYFYLREQLGTIKDCKYSSDGFYLVSILNAFLPTDFKFRRQSFDMTSLAPLVFEHAQKKGLSVFVAGGKPGEPEVFRRKMTAHYPHVQWAGQVDGFKDDEEIIHAVTNSQADIVLLGLGNIKQERVAVSLHQQHQAVYFTCGAFVSQTASAKDLKYYPDWINKYNLRWLYRFFKESHVIKRVVKYYLAFLVLFFKDLKRG
ncbi:WecB/TagA/CpsF family glycosyltransferase [Pseudoalteromonas ruthenica]|uniref:WecB/TagA/CpsF family glycosyltransferase n=1 Tax=Pseudoalteromonas ruthenica TaxID=151081 RepID=UPI00110A4AA1|nr:WecB/TagA/CpsF family glycosyltransferase [Pseudoalteromonas ruthenica]TMO46496.1 glycosyltransferase [Pseudoalteromonas ruthenica]TMO50332.1 glycosyltransferase [Pseudoalteromonas ruthenica]